MKTILAVIIAVLAAIGLGFLVARYRKGEVIKSDARSLSSWLKGQYEVGKSYVRNLFTKPATEKDHGSAPAAEGAAA